MADSKISALAAASGLVGTDEFVIATGGVSKKVTLTTLLAALPIVLLFDTVLGGDTANFDVSSIPGTYKHLRLVLQGRGSDSSEQWDTLRFNNDSGANYDRVVHQDDGSGFSRYDSLGATSIDNLITLPGSGAPSGAACETIVDIPNYADTTFHKPVHALGTTRVNTGANNFRTNLVAGGWRSTSAIDRVTLAPAAGNFKLGSRLTIYGLN
jgi:hypothetical protein